ncbi:MAG: hypothetical protein E7322_03520 [Clostridiales bacterium]|nr:hypothetical protein [Clostridiales bacterium]
MKKHMSLITSALIGGVYGAVSVFLSRIFIKNLGGIAGWGMKLFKANGEITAQVTGALGQLKDASIVSPYLVFILVFACLFFLIFRRMKKARKIVINITAWVLLLLPSLILASLFSVVNDILFLDVVKMLVSIVLNL